MATIRFLEKPGCINNTRQKKILAAAGHTVLAASLLDHPFNAAELRAWFGELPLGDWFNASAPRIRSGEVDPDHLDADQAIAAMLADRLLIRRPLMDIDGWKTVGFDPAVLAPRLGQLPADLEACSRKHGEGSCA